MTLPRGFASKYRVSPTGCLVWTRAIQTKGYGSVCVGRGRTALAHRVAWESARGPIPEGLTIDHLCGVKRCVNPDHMEVVTRGGNTRRYYRQGADRAA